MHTKIEGVCIYCWDDIRNSEAYYKTARCDYVCKDCAETYLTSEERIQGLCRPKYRFFILPPYHGENKSIWYIYDMLKDTTIENYSDIEECKERCIRLNNTWIEETNIHELNVYGMPMH